MNNVLSFVRAARSAANPGSVLYSNRMIAELLALNLEMIAQLRLELLSAGADGGFLKGMIEQHEKAAALLRAQLEDRQAAEKSAEEKSWRAGSLVQG